MLRSLFALLCSHGILLLANGLFGTIVSLGTKTANFPDAVIGLVLAGYFVGLLLSSFYAIKIVARIGHIRAFALFASLASTVALGHLLWVDPLYWGVLRAVMGFSMGGMIVVTEGWLNERADNQNRGTILSLYMIITYACLGLSQLFITFSHPDGFFLFVVVSILFSLALIPILMTQSQAPNPGSPNSPNIKQLLAVSPVGMVGSFTVGTVNGIYYSLAPIYAYAMGLPTEKIAIFIALSISSGMLLQVPLGRLSDRVDRRWVIVFSSLLTVFACYLLFNGRTYSVQEIFYAGVFYGSVAFSINPLCVAHVNDLSPPDQRTQTASGLLMLYGVGAVVGPVLAGFVLSAGAEYIFLISAVVMMAFAIYTLLRLLVKPRQLDNKPDFRPYSVLSPSRRLLFASKKRK